MIAKKYRIDRNLIPYILRKGQSFESKLFIIRFINNEKGHPRYRTIVSKKINNKATIRNKLRRRIYESAQKATKAVSNPKEADMMLIPKKLITKAKYQEIEEDIKKLIAKQSK